MARVSNVEWLNSNLNRNYPFKEGVSRGNGTVEIPTDFLVDAIFSGTEETLRYRINYIQVISTIAVSVGFMDTAGTFLGVVNVQAPLPTRYLAQFFQPASEAEISVRGRVVFGSGVTEVLSWGVGTYFFGLSSAELEPSLMIPKPNLQPKVCTISKLGDDENLLSGHVKLQEGAGVSITPIPALNTLRFDLNKVFSADCPEQVDRFDRCKNCIKSINGIVPNIAGGIELIGTEWIVVENDNANNRLKIRFIGDIDCCCTACDEFKALEDAVERLETELNEMSKLIPPTP